jgi:hypothetical protein
MLGEYPGKKIVLDREFLKKSNKLRKLQGHYNLGMKIDFALWITVFKSPIFRLSDIIAFMKIFQANGKIHSFLGDFNLRTKMRG